MTGRVNDWFRGGIARGIRIAGWGLSALFKWRLRRFAISQERLRRKYTGGSNKSTDGRFAFTSGSAGHPKRILYTNRRLRGTKIVFSDMFARACRAFRIRRTSIYVFSSFEPDDSLTSLLLDEVELPNYFATLQAPYRVQRHHAVRALAAEYGATAVRLWLITIANPGVFYSTNPSTISTFFDDLAHDWSASTELIRNWCKHPKRFNAAVHKIARRLASIGSDERLWAIANSNSHDTSNSSSTCNDDTNDDAPLPIEVWAPAVEAYVCWTGGYVKPFLDRLQKHLPSPRYRLIPMYSMSTETIETVAHFANNDVYFLPLAPGVVYEFLEHPEPAHHNNRTDHAHLNNLTDHAHTLKPTELEPGKLYEMIVTDAYGLRRYHTKDLFLCRRKINGFPDLTFQRRRGLAYSFTGEKLTAEQLTIVFDQLRHQHPTLFAGRYLTCVPAQPPHTLPHYNIFLIGERKAQTDLNDLAARCDQLLSEVNCEYRSKRASKRLGPLNLIETDTKHFAEQFAANGAWETQFKFLPLCPHLICNDTSRVS